MMLAMRVYKFLPAKFALKTLYERRLKISTFEDLNDPFDLTPFRMSDKIRRRAYRKFRKYLTSKYGVMSFSETWGDPVAWAHYADKHRGICLGFEIPEGRCIPVSYVPEPLPFRTYKTAKEFLHHLVATKYANWNYEREVRWFGKLRGEEDGLYYYPLGDDLQLRQVIAGHRCKVSRAAVMRVLSGVAKDVELIKARAAFTSFQIKTDKRGWK